MEFYPEGSPFELKPPLYNLIPEDLKIEDLDTPQFKDAAWAITNDHTVNPLFSMHGWSPLLLGDADVERLREKHPELIHYREPPPLPQIMLPDDIEFLARVNMEEYFGRIKMEEDALLVLARIGSETRLMKIVSESTCHHDLQLICCPVRSYSSTERRLFRAIRGITRPKLTLFTGKGSLCPFIALWYMCARRRSELLWVDRAVSGKYHNYRLPVWP